MTLFLAWTIALVLGLSLWIALLGPPRSWPDRLAALGGGTLLGLAACGITVRVPSWLGWQALPGHLWLWPLLPALLALIVAWRVCRRGVAAPGAGVAVTPPALGAGQVLLLSLLLLLVIWRSLVGLEEAAAAAVPAGMPGWPGNKAHLVYLPARRLPLSVRRRGGPATRVRTGYPGPIRNCWPGSRSGWPALPAAGTKAPSAWPGRCSGWPCWPAVTVSGAGWGHLRGPARSLWPGSLPLLRVHSILAGYGVWQPAMTLAFGLLAWLRWQETGGPATAAARS